jgi:hypothetical protein
MGRGTHTRGVSGGSRSSSLRCGRAAGAAARRTEPQHRPPASGQHVFRRRAGVIRPDPARTSDPAERVEADRRRRHESPCLYPSHRVTVRVPSESPSESLSESSPARPHASGDS